MNRLFLLIPAIGEQVAAEDIAYLKVLRDVDKDSFIGFFRKVNQSQKLIKWEDVDYYYDDNHLKAFVNAARAALEGSEEMPQLENLLVFFDDKKSIQGEKIGVTPIKVYGVDVKKGLLNAYMEGGPVDSDVLLNHDALNNPNRSFEIETPEGLSVSIEALDVKPSVVYLWLVKNRNPKRNIDPNAQKHKRKTRLGNKGVISPITYTIDQLDSLLQKAVPAKKGLREFYFKDTTANKLVIFFDENQANLYHAFEVPADDEQERQKMFKRGGRDLVNRVEATSQL